MHNEGDPTPSELYGVRYRTKTPTPGTKTIVLVHRVSPAHEYWDWSGHCDCDVETWTQAERGHAPAAHTTMPTFTAKVVAWLTSKGLAAR